MRISDSCGCFPTGRHYPGIAHLIRIKAVGVAEEFDAEGAWRDLPIAFIDTETTGTDATVDRIIEVGIVIGQSGEIKERHSWLINPGIPIPEDSTAIHGIKDADVADKPPFADVANEIVERLSGCLTAAYNASFDRGFVLAELSRANVEFEDPPPGIRRGVDWVDPLVFAFEFYQRKEGRSLGAVCERLGISLENAHRATDDAEAALKVLYAFAKDPRVPQGYATLIQEQRRLGRAQEEARRFWR
ncbi:3'-5' exonuclease [Endomicrobium sp. AH-315-J14]|nr:3'-5' exonuclease [Endomicrobium sp. AH-315-J14]